MPAAETFFLPSGETFTFTVQRSARRRRSINIRVRDDGSVEVRAPLRTSRAFVLEVLALRASWIAKHRAAVATLPKATLCGLSTVPYLGRDVPLVAGLPSTAANQPALWHDQCDCGDDGAHRARLIAWYRKAAETDLPKRVARLAPLVGRKPEHVVVSNQRAAWGSCSHDNVIRLSWRLMMLREDLVDAVVVHELCHLIHHNHSAAFWAEVHRTVPDFKAVRAELRAAALTLPL